MGPESEWELGLESQWELGLESGSGLGLELGSVLDLSELDLESVLDPGQADRPHRRRDQSCSSGHGRRQAAAAQRPGTPNC